MFFTLTNSERLHADQAASWCLEQAEDALRVDYHHPVEIDRDGVKRLQYRLLKFAEANRADGNGNAAYSTLFDRLTAWDRAWVANRRDELERRNGVLSYAQLEVRQ